MNPIQQNNHYDDSNTVSDSFNSDNFSQSLYGTPVTNDSVIESYYLNNNSQIVKDFISCNNVTQATKKIVEDHTGSINQIVWSKEAVCKIICDYKAGEEHPFDILIEAGADPGILKMTLKDIFYDQEGFLDTFVAPNSLDTFTLFSEMIEDFDERFISHFIEESDQSSVSYDHYLFNMVFHNIFCDRTAGEVLKFYIQRPSLWQQEGAKVLARAALEDSYTNLRIIEELKDYEEDAREAVTESLVKFIQMIYPDDLQHRNEIITAYIDISSDSDC